MLRTHERRFGPCRDLSSTFTVGPAFDSRHDAAGSPLIMVFIAAAMNGPKNDSQNAERPEVNAPGLCASCVHAQRIESSKGSTFVLCRLSYTDPRFVRYPRLPVLACDGYSPKGADNEKK